MSMLVHAAAATLLLALTGVPHSGNDGQDGAQQGNMQASQIRNGLYLISGGGSNTVVRLTGGGPIVVDGKSTGQYATLRKKIRRISEAPVRMLITTDHENDRTGNNAQFIASGAEVVAHENAKQNLIAEHRSDGESALPTSTYKNGFVEQVGSIQVRVMHFGNAHTSGDTVVYFPDMRVVAVGDLYASTPDPDFANGGSLVGWSQVLAEILKLDFELAVPGTGPIVRRADIEALKTKIDKLVADAAQLVRYGVPKNQLMAQLETDDLGWRFGFTVDQVDRFYAELSASN